ncbi:thiamine biosynthesis protein ApbE [Bosea sp. AAP35]|uniref:FAD:protein FMN transferase n=1 Tax=Bosea sp. AAP35 TaxID=1523417 RepID=UPI0006CDCD37|nr:FAD:protein FMN transferase [Bosea sp. AAP35]KPF65688.1 thiamine biosynthesis protein ApbE [Bosea sp. AAP35]
MSTEIPAAERRSLSGPTMGTRYSAVFFAPAGLDETKLAAALQATLDRVDRQMSTWKPESDLNRLNDAAVHVWVPVPAELMVVLQAALRIGRQSLGAFDIGVGDLVGAWGFGARPAPGDSPPGGPVVPKPAITAEALELDPHLRRARKHAPLALDLSGIAKGFGVDEMARVMRQFSIPAWLVGIDGEMRAGGAKPDGAPWVVAHERPARDVREAMGVIELLDRAVATSGNYRQYRDIGARMISHTMDPRSGLPLENELASVTVLADTCMEADAWATAFLVMGVEKALPFARATGRDVIFVLSDATVETTL